VDLKTDFLNWTEATLDQACRENPQLTVQWGIRRARARKKAAEAKNALKLCYAETSMDVRKDPASWGLLKVTEDSVEQVVIASPKYQECQRALLEADEEDALLDAVMTALADRREQLSNDVKLYGQQYWSKPDMSGAQPTEARRLDAAASATVNPRPRKQP
jgi:hypothetical protein